MKPTTNEQRIENIAAALVINARMEPRTAIDRSVDILKANGIEPQFVSMDNLLKMESLIKRRAQTGASHESA